MNSESFEKKLQLQTPRRIPPEWREGILSSVRANAADFPRSRSGWSWSVALECLHVLLWPCPRAWAVLAAVWLVILGFQFSARDNSSADGIHPLAASAAALALKEREQVLTELLREAEPLPAQSLPSLAVPPPRTERRNAFFQV